MGEKSSADAPLHRNLVDAVKKGQRDRVFHLISGMTRAELQAVVGPVSHVAQYRAFTLPC